jgi:hypothetical protein
VVSMEVTQHPGVVGANGGTGATKAVNNYVAARQAPPGWPPAAAAQRGQPSSSARILKHLQNSQCMQPYAQPDADQCLMFCTMAICVTTHLGKPAPGACGNSGIGAIAAAAAGVGCSGARTTWPCAPRRACLTSLGPCCAGLRAPRGCLGRLKSTLHCSFASPGCCCCCCWRG